MTSGWMAWIPFAIVSVITTVSAGVTVKPERPYGGGCTNSFIHALCEIDTETSIDHWNFDWRFPLYPDVISWFATTYHAMNSTTLKLHLIPSPHKRPAEVTIWCVATSSETTLSAALVIPICQSSQRQNFVDSLNLNNRERDEAPSVFGPDSIEQCIPIPSTFQCDAPRQRKYWTLSASQGCDGQIDHFVGSGGEDSIPFVVRIPSQSPDNRTLCITCAASFEHAQHYFQHFVMQSYTLCKPSYVKEGQLRRKDDAYDYCDELDIEYDQDRCAAEHVRYINEGCGVRSRHYAELLCLLLLFFCVIKCYLDAGVTQGSGRQNKLNISRIIPR